MSKRLTRSDLDLIELDCIRKSRKSFYAYRQYIHDFKLKTGWFVKEISKEIERFYDDYKAGKRPVLVIEAPPQHGKSQSVNDGIEWMAGKDPDLRFIYASFSERLGIRANLSLQRTAMRDKYHRIFPDTRINDRRTVTSDGYQRNREMVEFVERRGSFRNTTVQGSVTGETLDIGIIDDPIKGRAEANSATTREKAWNWFTDDFMTRFDEHAGLLIILTRWHLDDPVGRLRNIDPSIRVVSYKAIAENDEENRKAGEPLFPEHKSLQFLLERKSKMPTENWQALYQQNPVVKGGNMFKLEWWKYYRELPRLQWRAIYADTAQKTKEKNDYSVFQLWGKTIDGQAVFIDQIRGKWEAPELLVQARSFWDKHRGATNGTLRSMKVEDKSSGTQLIQTLSREGIPIIGIPRSTDKELRGNDASPLIESGNVLLPERAPFISEFLEEMVAFPNGTHDDQVDPMMDAVSDILQGETFDYAELL